MVIAWHCIDSVSSCMYKFSKIVCLAWGFKLACSNVRLPRVLFQGQCDGPCRFASSSNACLKQWHRHLTQSSPNIGSLNLPVEGWEERCLTRHSMHMLILTLSTGTFRLSLRSNTSDLLSLTQELTKCAVWNYLWYRLCIFYIYILNQFRHGRWSEPYIHLFGPFWTGSSGCKITFSKCFHKKKTPPKKYLYLSLCPSLYTYTHLWLLDIQHLSISLCGQCPLFYCLLHLFFCRAGETNLYTDLKIRLTRHPQTICELSLTDLSAKTQEGIITGHYVMGE